MENNAADSPELDNRKSRSSSATSFPRIWDIVVIAMLFLVGQAAVSFIALHAGIVDITAIPDPSEVEEYMDACVARGNSTAIMYPLSMVTIIIMVIAYMRIRGYRRVGARWSAKGLDPSIIVRGIVWIIALQVVIEPIVELLPDLDVEFGRGEWACLTAVVAAPIFEEYLFRGLLIDALATRYRALTSVLASAIVFGVMHVSPANAVSAFAIGVILGVIYLRTRSLLSTIILHAINNAMAFTLLCLNMKDLTFREMTGGGAVYYVTYAISAAITISMFFYAWNTVLKRR